MWHQHYKIAERQLGAGKFKTVEGHARKALLFAQSANDKEQIARTLSLLCKLYLKIENPQALETLRESAEYAEAAYGGCSVELAEELEVFSSWLQRQSEFEQAESLQKRALSIWETLDEPERLLSSLDRLTQFYLDRENFREAENLLLQALEMRKRMHGAVSKQVQDMVPLYAKILQGAGRHKEAAELETNVHHCVTCGPESKHVKYPAEVDAVTAVIQEAMMSGKLDHGIATLRGGVSKLQTIGDARAETVSDDDPFRPLKMRTLRNPEQWARSSLAQLLRVKGEREHKHEVLLEAAGHFRQILAESPNESDRMHLLLTLLDLSVNDPSHYEELERLLLTARQSASTLYTKALMLFRRFGSTSDTRAAMRAALDANRHVPVVLATGLDPAAVPNHFASGDLSEAEGYVLEARHQWHNTPGAVEFMIEGMASALRRTLGAVPSVPLPV